MLFELGSIKSKPEQSEIFLDLIIKSGLIFIERNNVLQINQKPLDVKVSSYLYILRQTTKNFKKYSMYHLIQV